MTQDLVKPETDHLARMAIRRLRLAEVAARGLDRADNGAYRIKQRSIPVKNEKLKSFGHSPVFLLLKVYLKTY